jgi:anti-anti-sigma factor
MTTVKCHGRVVFQTAGEMKEVVRPFIPLGGRSVIDLTDVDYLDSAGLAALVALSSCRLSGKVYAYSNSPT